ncbi:MAG: translation initiation factor [Anaeromyxobacter sp.]
MSRKPPPPPAPGPFNAAFARLREQRPDLPAPEAPAPAPAGPTPAEPAPARAVVRLERKGRGGKEATVVEKLELPPAKLSAWADALKRSLGCGGGVEGEALVVQGDQRDRVAKWLEQRGVRKVVRG